jgi:Tfp pilus assembly protein PilF
MSKFFTELVWTIPYLCATLLAAVPPVWAQEKPRNYYAISDRHDITLLRNVEGHHLTDGTFWKWYRAKKYDLAADELRFVLRYFPNHPKALQLMALIAKKSDTLHLAVPYYVQALELYPGYAATHAQYGAYLADIGNLKAGLAELEKAVQLDPELGFAYAALAKAYDKTGDVERSRKAAEKARQLGFSE